MENYQRIVDYLFQLQRAGVKWSLDNIRVLLSELGRPERSWPSVHIAGTNGKGSTAAILESILIQSGRKVGLYTSPHLLDFTERIRVNRQPIPQEAVIDFTAMIRSCVERIQPSFFEVSTAMAFWYFREQGVDIAILETGMGGRLDSTNVVSPLATAITPVDMDHQNYLGNTLEEIAAEKAGIIKPGVVCLTNNHDPRILRVLEQKCKKTGSSFENIFDNSACSFRQLLLYGSYVDLRYRSWNLSNIFLSLAGLHQSENALLALAIAWHLQESFPVSERSIQKGLASVAWRGRLDLVSASPPVIVDVSHNPAGVKKSLDFVHRFFPKTAIRAAVYLQDDKDYVEVGKLLAGGCQRVYVIPLSTRAPLPPEKLYEAITAAGGTAQILDNFSQLLDLIQQTTADNQPWLLIGSHYLAGEAYRQLNCSITNVELQV